MSSQVYQNRLSYSTLKKPLLDYVCTTAEVSVLKPSPILEMQKGNITGTTTIASCDTDEYQIPSEKGPGTMRKTKSVKNLLENMRI